MQDTVATTSIPVPRWAYLAVAIALGALYLLTLENGALLAERASLVHELLHDARHFTGVPCH